MEEDIKVPTLYIDRLNSVRRERDQVATKRSFGNLRHVAEANS